MSITVRSDDGVTIVSLAGTADHDMLMPLRDPLIAALGDSPVVVVDLDELTNVDPAALRSLVVAVLDQARGGQMRLVASDPATVAVITEARLHHHVAVHRTVFDARRPSTDPSAGRP
jgi:anti-anti-sigma factor